MESRVRVGTSGWSYHHWRGAFYPPDLSSASWLRHYAERFDCVEVNASFYRLPSEQMLRRWIEVTPDDFVFVLKGSRLITHARRLDASQALRTFVARARVLGSKLRCILWQLGPTFERDVGRLARFIEALPSDASHAIEFRHPSWDHHEVEALLTAAGVARVLTAPGSPPGHGIPSFVYVRFHGREGNAAYGYPQAALREWAAFLSRIDRQGIAAFAFFNNDGGGRAPRDAATLLDLLKHPRTQPRRRRTPAAFRSRIDHGTSSSSPRERDEPARRRSRPITPRTRGRRPSGR